MRTIKQNWFDTLNQALESEDLVHLWPLGSNIGYGENVRHHVIEASGKERFISVYRETDGRYERPVHYLTGYVLK